MTASNQRGLAVIPPFISFRVLESKSPFMNDMAPPLVTTICLHSPPKPNTLTPPQISANKIAETPTPKLKSSANLTNETCPSASLFETCNGNQSRPCPRLPSGSPKPTNWKGKLRMKLNSQAHTLLKNVHREHIGLRRIYDPLTSIFE